LCGEEFLKYFSRDWRQNLSSKKEVVKNWIDVVTPDYLGGKDVGSMLVSSDEEAVGRKLILLQSDITEDPAHSFTKIMIKVTDVSGSKARTTYWGHEISRDYLRSVLRKGSSKIGQIVDADTKDGFKLRVTVTAISRHKVSKNKKTFLSNQMADLIRQRCSSLKLSQFVQEILSGKTESDLFNFAKKHMLVKFTGVTKVKVLQSPFFAKAKAAA